MEYMRIGGFLGNAVSKLVNKGVEAKVGFKPGIDIRKLDLSTDEDENYVRLDVSAIMRREDFEKLFEEVTK